MAQTIKAFRATYYNPSIAGDLSDLVCPPYDVISSQDLKLLRRKSRYNFSRVLIAEDNDYQAKRRLFDTWLQTGVLTDDRGKGLYLYEQQFSIDRRCYSRYGLIGLLKMDVKGIFPHERTHRAPKIDRSKMLNAVQSNLSPIFVIASRQVKALAVTHNAYAARKPFFECRDMEGNLSRLWRIQDAGEITKLCAAFAKARLVIADGHHRFETSFAYFRKHKRKFKDLNYVLAFITDRQEGLVILPTHRILALNRSDKFLFGKLKPCFIIRQVSQARISELLQKQREFCFGLYRKSKFYFLSLKDKKILDTIAHPLYRKLDTYIFHKVILPRLEATGGIEYTHSIAEAKKLARADKVAFLLRPAALDAVFELSSEGKRLPQKTTYFYPKLLSGLLMRRFSNENI